MIIGNIVPTLSFEQQIPESETVGEVSFLSTVLELCSVTAVSRKPFGIGHVLRVTDTITFPAGTHIG
jgi:hypothetical protein